MAILIKSGKIITSSESFYADILIEGEKISAVAENIPEQEGMQIIDAKGKLVLPGGVDVHTHFDLPMFGTVSSDDHYTGHKAAAFGGTTTVIDFVSQDFPHLKDCVDAWHQKADDKAAVDYGFHMNMTNFNEDIAKEIPTLKDEGISTLKVFTAYNGRLRLHDGEIFKVMRIARDNGMLVMVHAENGDVIDVLTEEALTAGHTAPEWHALTRPAWGAVEAVFRSIALAVQAEAPVYIVHMNTAGGVEQVRQARQQGLPVMGETCPQYMFFNMKHLRRPDASKWICSPPMRSEADNAAIWKAVEDGTIQTMATDHCAFFYDGTTPIDYEGQPVAIPGKELGQDDFTKIPNGLPGVGDRLMVLWSCGVGTHRISPNRFVELTSTNPAKVFGMYPQKGTLLPGSDADIAIWDPDKEIQYGHKYAQHRTDYNLYEGWPMKGVVEKVLLRGKLIVDGSHWLGGKGEGKFIHRSETKVL
ncbi:MAG: dihydropyrimidinase [Chloroflexota bacterium]|nr:dihydropyrimidinase [Chloroflexota bacterium]